jgi:hypothetical protein
MGGLIGRFRVSIKISSDLAETFFSYLSVGNIEQKSYQNEVKVLEYRLVL